MEDPERLRELTTEIQRAVDAYIKSEDTADYKTLQACITRLLVCVTKPADVLYSFRTQAIENVAIVILIETGIFDALVQKQGATVTATELAAATGCNKLVIVRLMRVACALVFCEETDEMTYRANAITSLLVKPGWKGGLRWAEIIYPAVMNIRRFLAQADFVRTGDQSAPSAFEFLEGKSIWKVLEEQPDLRRDFDLFMRERRESKQHLWYQNYPPSASLSIGDLKADPEAVLMVDVGGALGSQLVNFKTQFPHLPGRYVLQDLQLSESASYPEGVEVMEYDFFTPQPIKGARFYYFRHVFHNWSDQKCIEILRTVVQAMDSDYSTLLIDDFVLPVKGCQRRAAMADMVMMVLLNSMERTSTHYEQLLRSAGLEISNIFSVGTNEEAIIEARIARK